MVPPTLGAWLSVLVRTTFRVLPAPAQCPGRHPASILLCPGSGMAHHLVRVQEPHASLDWRPAAPTMLAITQESEMEDEQSRSGRLLGTLRARSLSPCNGPLLGSRTDLIDGATDARVFPTILWPYTFPTFQVGSALPPSLQDQSECAYMVAKDFSACSFVACYFLLFSMLCCLHRCFAHIISCCLWCGTQCPGLRTPHTGELRSDPCGSLIRQCFRPFRILCKQLLLCSA